MKPELRDYITESNKAVKEIESKGFLYQGLDINRDQVCCFKNGQYFYADNAISLLESLKFDDKFHYMMLSRLQMDCKYFLGNGCGNVKHLWADSVEEHIAEMKRLYDLLPVKPEWLSMDDILDYEAKMIQ